MPADLQRSERAFTIRQLCQEFKCTARALRFYEEKGLLSPARSGQTRLYSGKDRARLQLILQGKSINLSLAEIAEILEAYDKAGASGAQDTKVLQRLRSQLAKLERQREQIDEAIQGLKEAAARLEAALAANRPDLLPWVQEYDRIMREGVDGPPARRAAG
jgi:DNA-binding transcriptional MerR regulator